MQRDSWGRIKEPYPAEPSLLGQGSALCPAEAEEALAYYWSAKCCAGFAFDCLNEILGQEMDYCWIIGPPFPRELSKTPLAKKNKKIKCHMSGMLTRKEWLFPITTEKWEPGKCSKYHKLMWLLPQEIDSRKDR